MKTILHSSEEVISVTGLLKNGLENIVSIKDKLLDAMQSVENISQQSVQNTTDISASAEEQAAGLENILRFMEDVQSQSLRFLPSFPCNFPYKAVSQKHDNIRRNNCGADWCGKQN